VLGAIKQSSILLTFALNFELLLLFALQQLAARRRRRRRRKFFCSIGYTWALGPV
jgi:hypothetical protein